MKTILEPDACDLLDADHVAVEHLFAQYRRLTGSRTQPALKQRAGLARDICLILAVHARLEHEVFYPAVQAALSVADILAEAQVEHECVHYLMVRIEQKAQVDTAFDALVNTLSLYVEHQMRKARLGIFPVVRTSCRLDMALLRRTLDVRRRVIFQEESDKVAARLQQLAQEKARQRELTIKKGRAAAKVRKYRGGSVVVHTLALREVR